jgi:hypothetical protein
MPVSTLTFNQLIDVGMFEGLSLKIVFLFCLLVIILFFFAAQDIHDNLDPLWKGVDLVYD